jgi:rubredoxin
MQDQKGSNEFRCAVCNFGARRDEAPPHCPVCGCSDWRLVDASPHLPRRPRGGGRPGPVRVPVAD